MKMKIFFIVLVLLAVNNTSLAQSKLQATEIENTEENLDVKELNFRFMYRFAPRTFFIYKCTIDTEILRAFPDSSTKNFKRKEEVYITLRDPSGEKDGFVELNTGIDSIYYEFSDGEKSVKWWSQSDHDPYPTNPDFVKRSALIGQFFISTISPYFEVAKIDGDFLQRAKDNIDDMSDTTLRFIFQQALSDENLKLYTDLNKNVIKNGRFKRDSTWKMKFSIPIEGINYTCDTANVTFYLYDTKNYHIKAEMPFMKPDYNTVVPIVGLDRVLSTVDSASKSSGYWDVTLSPRGRFEEATGEFNTIANIKLDEALVTDTIKTKINFKLLETYRWKD